MHTATPTARLQTRTDAGTLLAFLNPGSRGLTLVRLFNGEDRTEDGRLMQESDVDVAVARDHADLVRLIESAYRDPYFKGDVVVRYRATYCRLCHLEPPRDWLDRQRPRLTMANARQYPAFLLDVDAVKIGCEDGVESATDAEQAVTVTTTEDILRWMDSVIGPDRSYCLTLDSGNGTQTIVRGTFDLQDAALARTLLLRMKTRWPSLDSGGWQTTVGPALPGTKKCKGQATAERPHRTVRVLRSYPGTRQLTRQELQKLVDSLPAVSHESSGSTENTPAHNAFSAVGLLSYSDVSKRHFNAVVCPWCRSDVADGDAVALVRPNLLVCKHERRCPAASVGKTGFTAVHLYANLLGYSWGPFTEEQRQRIVEAAVADGFELKYDDGTEPELPKAERELLRQQVDKLLSGMRSEHEPSRHVSVHPAEPWTLKSRSARQVAARLETALMRAYAPGMADDSPDRVLVMAGRLHAYHQQLGIYVPITSTGEASDEPRITRILLHVEENGGVNVHDGDKLKSWSAPRRAVTEELEQLCSIPTFFTTGKVGIACSDGFLALHDHEWVALPHSRANRALGRVSRSCEWMLREIQHGYESEAALALRAIMVKTLRRDDAMIDDLLRIVLEQVGAVLCRVKPKLRSALFVYGAEDTGKSTLLNIAAAMIRRAGLSVTSSSLADINHAFPPESLLGAAANIHVEDGSFARGRVVKTSRLKQLVEGSQWSFARKNRSNLDVSLQPLMMFALNDVPQFDENSGAVAKRAYVIRYPDTATAADQRDEGLEARFLRDHLDGIIAASLVGAEALQRNGRTELHPDSEIARHTREVARKVGLVEAWMQSGRAAESPSNQMDATRDEAHGACLEWGERHGFKDACRGFEPGDFTREVNKLCKRQSRRSNNVTYAPVMLLAPVVEDN